jgi:hypothetical protein
MTEKPGSMSGSDGETLNTLAFRWLLLIALAVALLVGCKDDQPPVKPPVKPPPPPADVQVTVTKTPVLTAKARIPQNDPNFVRAEATADGVVFHFSAKPTVDLQVDNVVAGGDGTSNTYLRKITKVVSRTDTRIEVKTTSAYITDLIGEADFSLKMTPEASKWTLHTAPEIGGRTYALDTKINIFELFKSPKGFSCKGAVSSLPVTPILRPDVSFEISQKITPIYDPLFGVVPISGKLDRARFVVNGSVEVGLKVTIPKKMSLTCTQDMIKYIRNLTGNPNLLALKRHAFVQIGPVPVEATIVLEPVFTVEVALESQIAEPTTSTFAVKLSMTAGLEYDGSKPQGQRNNVIFKHNTSYTKNNLLEKQVDKLTLTGKGSAGFKIGMLLYDTVGPEVSLTAYAQHKLEAKPPECSWYSETSLGADLGIGIKVQVPVIAYELLSVSEKLPLKNWVIGHSSGELPECSLDAGVDVGPEAGPDAGPDMATDLKTDLPLADAPPDAPPADAAPDASSTLLSSGRLLFPNRGLNAIVVFDPVSQKVVGTVPVPSPHNMTANLLFTALYRAADKSIYLNVSNGTVASVIAFTEGGTILGSRSSGEKYIQQMIFDPLDTSQKTILAGAPFSNDVKAINPITGTLSTRLTITKGNIIGLIKTGGMLLVGDHSSGTLRLHANSGAAISTFADLGTLTGKTEVNGMTRDAVGNIYIAQNSSSRIVKLTAAGALTGYISVSVFNKPAYVFFNPKDGLLYVGNQGDDGLVIVNTSGVLIKRVGLGGSNIGQGTVIP